MIPSILASFIIPHFQSSFLTKDLTNPLYNLHIKNKPLQTITYNKWKYPYHFRNYKPSLAIAFIPYSINIESSKQKKKKKKKKMKK